MTSHPTTCGTSLVNLERFGMFIFRWIITAEDQKDLHLLSF